MRTLLFFLSFAIVLTDVSAQVPAQSTAATNDFIVLRKRNNRTLKTYGEGSFLSAKTNTGFQLNGFITAIRNDSIFVRQQQTKLVATEFGQSIDTVYYSFGFDHRNISEFYFSRQYDPLMRRRGFVQVTLPAILMIGGLGFTALELINTAYRKEKLNDNKKLLSLGIALGVAGTGVLLQTINTGKNKVGNKYKVYYIRNPRSK